MKRSKYDPLPQFSESDSDIDIFDAKSTNYDTLSKHQRWTKKTRTLLGLLIIIVSLTSIVIAVTIQKKGYKKEKLLLVETECGPVLGYKETVAIAQRFVTTYVYEGIPYAKPPIADLRWSPPVRLSDDKKDCWRGTFNAIKPGHKCFQGDTIPSKGCSEDCLYLNVHTPDIKGELPVFVWIFGGFLMFGAPDLLGYSPNSEFIASMNIVSVSMNYRLNAFGFLTLKELRQNGTDGNYGFMDQILALRWIQSNIRNFGGDPNSVTICGQSSGGTSIFGLLASPLADGLFHKAIPMSGSPKFEKSYVDAEAENRIFVNNTKCVVYSSPDDIRKCLHKLSSKEVYLAIPQNVYPNWAMTDLNDFPTKDLFDGALAVVDGKVVVKPPKNLSSIVFKSKTKVSVLIGSTAQEIAFEPVQNFSGPNAWNEFNDFLKMRLDAFSPTFIDMVWGDLYKNETDKNGTIRNAQYLYETISSDVRVTCPLNKLFEDFQKSKHHKVFRYVVTNAPNKMITSGSFKWKNAFHMWDSDALFGYKKVVTTGYKLSKSDINFMKSIRAVVSKFMREGLVDWEPSQTGIFNPDGEIDVLNETYHHIQCEFWNDVNNGFVPYAWIN